jgi:AmpD protein
MNFLKVVTKTLEANDKRAKTSDWVGIIVHHTGIGGKNNDPGIWEKMQANVANWLTKKDDNYLSAHFQIGRFGEVWQLVDPRTHVAYHAGKSSYYHPKKRAWVQGWNEFAIGIELLGDGNLEPYSDAQYAALSQLCTALMSDFPTIEARCITGHENIAPDRKVDPGKLFQWNRFFSMLKFTV